MTTKLRVVARSLPGLKRLYLSASCPFPSRFVTDGAMALVASSFRFLKKLDLNGATKITDWSSLKLLTSLQSLSAHCSYIDGAALEHIAQLDKLEELGLDETRISDVGLASLSSLVSLSMLCLGNNLDIGDAGLKHLVGLVKLEKLELCGTSVKSGSLSHLASMTRLKHLNWSNNEVGDEGIVHLLKLSSLETLDVWGAGTVFTEAGLERLRTGISNLKMNDQDSDEEDVHEMHGSILQKPRGVAALFVYYLMLPLRLSLHYTIPDVRNSKWTRCYALTMLLSVVWLAVLAEFMMDSAIAFGCIFNIEGDLMGLTVTAAGTSMPNLFSSLIVAKQGLGNMAISNAFGSNTFNIFIALALPWLVGSILNGMDGGAYSFHVPRGNIFASCQLLGLVLVAIVGTIVASDMRLTKSLGWPYVAAYVVIITGLCISA